MIDMRLVTLVAALLSSASCTVLPWPKPDTASAPPAAARGADLIPLPPEGEPSPRAVADCSEDEAATRRARAAVEQWRAYAAKLEQLLGITHGEK